MCIFGMRVTYVSEHTGLLRKCNIFYETGKSHAYTVPHGRYSGNESLNISVCYILKCIRIFVRHKGKICRVAGNADDKLFPLIS